MSYTKGPWQKGRIRANGFIDIRSNDNRTICEVIPQLPTETESNAKLIAAAPELLEACKELTDYFRSNPNVQKMQGPEYGVWHRAKAAIAKAEGRE